jgi:hypothetical protein
VVGPVTGEAAMDGSLLCQEFGKRSFNTEDAENTEGAKKDSR